MQKEGFEYDYVFDWTIVDKVDKPIANTIDRRTGPVQASMLNEGASRDPYNRKNDGEGEEL